MDYRHIAQEIKDANESIFLIYAFNGVGKTQLSVAYKDITKNGDDHTGVYYNAYSEDLFVWDNDEKNDNANIKLTVVPSSLNVHHSFLLTTEKDEDTGELIYPIQKKLKMYNPRYTFKINRFYTDKTEKVIDEEKGIASFSFYAKDDKEQNYPIKISRGEERIFVWCFFLTLIEEIAIDSEYIFIDDPVSSLDDHNIFITAFSLFDFIERFYDKKKIIVTTHHIGFATILGNWLSDPNNPFRGNKGRNKYALRGLSNDKGDLSLVSFERQAVWLYHLRMLQVLGKAIQEDNETGNGIEIYHMAILRQILENISSFLGEGRISYVLEEIGYSKEEANKIAVEDNALTHRNVYFPQSDIMVPEHKDLLKDVFRRISEKYHFQYKQ
jgi:hypothetical protein